MTTEELERDLQSLAEPRETDEHLRLAVRARLGKQLLARPPRRIRPARGIRWTAVAAARDRSCDRCNQLAGRSRPAVRGRRGDHPSCASGDHVAGERQSRT